MTRPFLRLVGKRTRRKLITFDRTQRTLRAENVRETVACQSHRAQSPHSTSLKDDNVGCRTYGVSDKVLSMSFANLLLAGDADRERWKVAGAGMIAIDTLVHNWLHRSGILKHMVAEHAYGSQCYGTHGCASIITTVAKKNRCPPVQFGFSQSVPAICPEGDMAVLRPVRNGCLQRQSDRRHRAVWQERLFAVLAL